MLRQQIDLVHSHDQLVVVLRNNLSQQSLVDAPLKVEYVLPLVASVQYHNVDHEGPPRHLNENAVNQPLPVELP